MIMKVFNIFRKSTLYYAHYRRIFKIFKGFNSPSYCEDKDKIKSKTSQFIDYLYLFFVLKILPSNYHLYCFDTKDRKQFKEYMGDTWEDPFTRKGITSLWKSGMMIRDKLIFKCICEYHNIPVPRNYGIYRNGVFYGQGTDLKDLMLNNNLEKIVLKPILGLSGVGIQFISRYNLDSHETLVKAAKEEYIVEEVIEQHPELEKINPHSVNTVRVITFLCPDGTVEFLATALKTSQSTVPVDNIGVGGIAIGINTETGKLKKEGFVKFFAPNEVLDRKMTIDEETIKQIIKSVKKMELLYPGKILIKHPITQTEFLNLQIPYWDELKEIAIKAQKVFCHGKTIAWDIAITPKSPVIIEGNEGWSTGFQSVAGGFLNAKNRRLFALYGISFY